jgi:large subunit ribosomal protein L13
VLTGGKEEQKMYRRHSGYPGALKERQAKFVMAEKPEFIVEKAVKGMLPKSRLGRKMYKKLKVYSGPSHPHEAQRPEKLEL